MNVILDDPWGSLFYVEKVKSKKRAYLAPQAGGMYLKK
jgi:hypothetical protein